MKKKSGSLFLGFMFRVFVSFFFFFFFDESLSFGCLSSFDEKRERKNKGF